MKRTVTSGGLLPKALWYTTAAAGVAGLSAQSADAQIVYTDVEPDVTIMDAGDLNTTEEGGYFIDFDGDGDPEVVFLEDTDRSYTVIAAAGEEGSDALSAAVGVAIPFGGVDYVYPYGLDAGASIGPNTKELLETALATFTYQSSDPNGLVGAGDKFAGIRFTLDTGAQHYAWIRFEMAENGQITVKDYAFESTPDTEITAGAGATASDPDALESGYLFSEVSPNPVAGRSTFQLSVGQAETVTAELFDALGRSVQTLFTGALTPGTTQTVAVTASELPAGVYVVRVTGDSFVTTRNVTVVR